jgi:hypothetical protein
LRALAVIVLAPAFALGAVAGAVGIVGRPAQPTAGPASLVWAERVFPTRNSFDTWLRARGASYETWAARHPSAAAAFGGRDQRSLAAEPPARPAKASARRTYGHSWIVALIAVVSIALLVALYALRSRLTMPSRQSPWLRPRPVKPIPVPHPRLPALTKGVPDWPLLATAATAAWRRPSSLVAAAHDELTARRVRRLLPTFAFYALAVALAVVVGASVAIYFQ